MLTGEILNKTNLQLRLAPSVACKMTRTAMRSSKAVEGRHTNRLVDFFDCAIFFCCL